MKRLLLIILIIILFQETVFCLSFYQKKEAPLTLSTINWLKDDLTISFITSDKPESEIRSYLSGIRFLFEPQFGYIFQGSNLNTIDIKSIQAIPKFGFESNIFESWASLQLLLVPSSSIQLDEKSDIIKRNLLNYPNKTVTLNWGFGIGLSLFDGIFTFGYMNFQYDQRDFKSRDATLKSSGFMYVNFQLVSTIRSIIKRSKG